MISFSEAKKSLESVFVRSKIINIPLTEATDMVLAAPAISTCDVPQFHNSAMDGYAFQFAGWRGQTLVLTGESAAGKPSTTALRPGEAMRIFTGAAVPDGADTVVMQEKAMVENGALQILDENLVAGSNVRLQGSQSLKGEVGADIGSSITPGMAGYLAGLGIHSVSVFSRPKVTVVVTGDEIVSPGKELKTGEVYECNSHALSAALRQYGIVAEIIFCRDSEAEIRDAVGAALAATDLLFVTGGVSVGDYDFVVPALIQNGVEKVFHGVKQKPAKPLFVGKKNKIPVFGLPGNPASVLTSFYVYASPVLRYMRGETEPWKYLLARISADFNRKPGLTQFLKGNYGEGMVKILPGQESYRMDGFAFANCLIEVSEDVSVISADEVVSIIPF